jgi:hypothetical protein
MSKAQNVAWMKCKTMNSSTYDVHNRTFCKTNYPPQCMIRNPDSIQEKCINSSCVKQWILNIINTQSVQSRHENQKANRSKFSLTNAQQYDPLNPCLWVVCDNILLSKFKTLFGEEKRLASKSSKILIRKVDIHIKSKVKSYHTRV